KAPNTRQPNAGEHRPTVDSHSTPPRINTTRLAMEKGKYATPEPRTTPRSSTHDRIAKGRAARACAEGVKGGIRLRRPPCGGRGPDAGRSPGRGEGLPLPPCYAPAAPCPSTAPGCVRTRSM